MTILNPISHSRLLPAFPSKSAESLCFDLLLQRASGQYRSLPRGPWCPVSDRSKAVFGFVANRGWAVGNFFSRCKILKQPADRTYVHLKATAQVAHDGTNYDRGRNFAARQTLVSRSETKFFLDTPGQSQYVDRKFFGEQIERAKFHLLALNDLLNCRTYSGGGLFSSSHRICAALRKAEGRKQGLEHKSKQLTKASGKKRLLGFFLFPANMEEGDFRMNRNQINAGGKGDGHIA